MTAAWRLAIAAVLHFTLAACTGETEPHEIDSARLPAPSTLAYHRVESRPFHRHVRAAGLLESERDAYVTAKIYGQIDSVLVALGERVSAGQPLSTIRDSSYALTRDLRAARLREHKRLYDQTQALHAKGLASTTELDNTRDAYEVARISLALAEDSLRQSRVVAPFEGIVGEIRARAGATVAWGDSLFRVTDLKPLFARAFVAESLVQHVRVGQPASLRCRAFPDHQIQAEIKQVGQIVNSAGGTLEVVLRLAGRNNLSLGPGMAVSVDIQAGDELCAALPEIMFDDADIREGALTVLTTVDDGITSRRTVILGQREDGWVEIRTGLQSNDSVLVPAL